MIIPRYSPIYTFTDLTEAWRMCLTCDPREKLSEQLAKFYAVKHVILFGSARSALYALLKAYDRPGDVIVPAYNCIAVPEAVLYAGYSPEFVDIDLGSYNMTAKGVKRAISSNTTAVLITHQFGIPCEINEILPVCRQHKVLVIEDAAAALGAKVHDRLVGSFGDAAIISFHPTKVLSGVSGGALLTEDDDIARRVEKLLRFADVAENSLISFAKAIAWKSALNPRVYSVTRSLYRLLRRDELFEIVAPHYDVPKRFFSHCSNFTSALIYLQLEKLSSIVNHRRELAHLYSEELSGSSYWDLPKYPQNSAPSWTQFPLLVKDKRNFYEYMQANGIDLSWTHKYSCAESFGLSGFPGAGQAARSVVGLPTYPSLGKERAMFVCDRAKAFVPIK